MAKAKIAAPKAAKKTSSVGRIAGGVVAGTALLALPFLQANSAIDWAVVQLIGRGQIYHTTVMPKPGLAGFSAKNVEITTGNTPIRIGEIEFIAPKLWLLAATYTRTMFTPSLNHVEINYKNIDNPDGYSLTSGELPIGPRSAAFAELEGCGKIFQISDTQLNELGLTPGETSISYLIDIEGSQVTTTETQSTPGLGSATFTRVGEGTRPGKRLFETYGLPDDIVWKTHSWQFTDDGFIKARNIFCARESGVTVEKFLANHVASIERNMAALGITVGAQMRAMYIDYAANGGKLALTGNFTRSLTEADYYDISWGAQLRSLEGEMQRMNQRVVASFQAQRERPFSEVDDELTTYEVLQREGVSVDPLVLPEPGAFALQLAAAGTDASASAVTNADGTASETMVVKVKVDPYMTSQLVSVPDEDPVYITNFDQMANLVGRKVRIERRGRPVMIAKVLGRGELGLRVKVSIASGFAEIDVPRGEFVRAQVYPVR